MIEAALHRFIDLCTEFYAGASAIMPATDTIVAGSLVALAAAVVFVPVMSRLGLGTMLGYLAAGIFVGPYGLGTVTHVETLMNFAEFGIVLMMFLIGLELDVGRLWKMRLPVFGGGTLQMLLCALPFAGIMYAAGLEPAPAVLAGFALAMSSTAVAVQEMNSRSMMAQPAGQNAFSILLFQDLASIPLIGAIPAVAAVTAGAAGAAGAAGGSPAFMNTVVRALLALVVMVGLGRFLTVPFLRFTVRSGAREMLTAFALLITVCSAWIMEAAGLSSAMGGFVGGVILGSSGFRHQLEAEISTFKELLLGLFFVTVGMSIDLNLVFAEPVTLAAVIATLLAVKTVMIFFVAIAMRIKGAGNRLKFAVVLSQGGEFAFVVFAIAKSQGVLPGSWAAILTAAVAISMGTTPILMKLMTGAMRYWLNRVNRSGPQDDAEALAAAPNRKVIIAGFGDFGALVARMLVAMDVTPTIIDSDPDRVRQARHFGVKVYYGDASSLRLLRAAGADEAKILVVAVGQGEAGRRIIEAAREAFPLVEIISQVGEVKDELDFMNKGVHPYSKSFEPSLLAGRRCLVDLGILSPYEAKEIADIFRFHTVKTLREISSSRYDYEQAVAAYRSNDEMLTEVIGQIREYRRERLAAVRAARPGAAEGTLQQQAAAAPRAEEPPSPRGSSPAVGAPAAHRMADPEKAREEGEKLDLSADASMQARRSAMEAVRKEKEAAPAPNPSEELSVQEFFRRAGDGAKGSGPGRRPS